MYDVGDLGRDETAPPEPPHELDVGCRPISGHSIWPSIQSGNDLHCAFALLVHMHALQYVICNRLEMDSL